MRYFRALRQSAAMLALLGCCAAAWGGDYIFEFGLSMKEPQFQVKGVNGGPSSLGKLTSGRTWLPTVGISSPNRYFGGSDHWGYYYYGDLSYAKIDRQTDSGPGYVPGVFPPLYARQADAGVALFLSFGDKLLAHPAHGKQFKIGVGVGLSYASLKGTVPGQYMQGGQPQYVNSSGWGSSANFIMRQTVDAWYLELDIYGATLSSPSRNYSISDGSVTLGYRIPFTL